MVLLATCVSVAKLTDPDAIAVTIVLIESACDPIIREFNFINVRYSGNAVDLLRPGRIDVFPN